MVRRYSCPELGKEVYKPATPPSPPTPDILTPPTPSSPDKGPLDLNTINHTTTTTTNNNNNTNANMSPEDTTTDLNKVNGTTAADKQTQANSPIPTTHNHTHNITLKPYIKISQPATNSGPPLNQMLLSIHRHRNTHSTHPPDKTFSLQLPLHRLLPPTRRNAADPANDLDVADWLHVFCELKCHVHDRMDVSLGQADGKVLVWRIDGGSQVCFAEGEMGLEAAILEAKNGGKGTVIFYVVDCMDLKDAWNGKD